MDTEQPVTELPHSHPPRADPEILAYDPPTPDDA